MTEGHGDDIYRYSGLVKVNFSTNIWQYPDLSALKRFMASKLDFVASYPEPEPYSLEHRLADDIGIEYGQIMVTAGVTDAIYTIARNIAAGRRSGIVGPTFAEYADACSAAGVVYDYFGDAEEAAVKSDVVWICNPNNPDGRVIDANGLAALIASRPSVMFVIDTAYSDYCRAEKLDVSTMAGHDNVILLHSLTKQCCVPGLRVGYLTASTENIRFLRRHRMPWAVNALASSCAEFLLDNPPVIPVDMLLAESKRMQCAMAAMGYDVTPSATNFFLGAVPCGSAAALKEWLVSRHGLLIRDASNFAGLSAGHFRIAAQRGDENDLLLDALKEWIGKYC